jgi:hypothetical protein
VVPGKSWLWVRQRSLCAADARRNRRPARPRTGVAPGVGHPDRGGKHWFVLFQRNATCPSQGAKPAL